jgi:hypothetical protein
MIFWNTNSHKKLMSESNTRKHAWARQNIFDDAVDRTPGNIIHRTRTRGLEGEISHTTLPTINTQLKYHVS